MHSNLMAKQSTEQTINGANLLWNWNEEQTIGMMEKNLLL